MNEEYIKTLKNTYFLIIAFSLFFISLVFDPSSDIEKARYESKSLNSIVDMLEIKNQDRLKLSILSKVGEEEFGKADTNICSKINMGITFDGLVVSKRDVSGNILSESIPVYISGLYVSGMFGFRDAFKDEFITSDIFQERQRSFSDYRKEASYKLKIGETIDLVNSLSKIKSVQLLPVDKYNEVILDLIPVDSGTGSVLKNKANVKKTVKIHRVKSSPSCNLMKLNPMMMENNIANKKTGKIFQVYRNVDHRIRWATDLSVPYYYVQDAGSTYILNSIITPSQKGRETKYVKLLAMYCETFVDDCRELISHKSLNDFNTLNKYQLKLKSESLSDLDRILNIPLLDSKKEISLFGFSINLNMLTTLGPAIVLLLMVYLILHLKKFDVFVARNTHVPWMATYVGLWTTPINVICLIAIPVASVYYNFCASNDLGPWFVLAAIFTVFSGGYCVFILNNIKNSLNKGISEGNAMKGENI